MVRNIDIAQSALGRTILIENPTHYMPLDGHCWSEADFPSEVARRTGCGLLLERDDALPPFADLVAERNHAETLMHATAREVQHA